MGRREEIEGRLARMAEEKRDLEAELAGLPPFVAPEPEPPPPPPPKPKPAPPPPPPPPPPKPPAPAPKATTKKKGGK